MHKFVIDRSEWLRGEGESYLLRSFDNKMCCLGFYLKSEGFTTAQLKDVAIPRNVQPNNKIPEWLLYFGLTGTACSRLMDVNDRPNDKASREGEITQIFADHGVEVTFIDGGNE